MAAIEKAIKLQLNTAREVLLSFPQFVYLGDEDDEPYLDELDAIWNVEKRDKENVRLLDQELRRREESGGTPMF